MSTSPLPTLAAFSAACATSFVVAECGGLSLTLAEATSLAPQEPQANGFALLFNGPLAPGLAQGTYTLDHADLGPLAIFLVPVARHASGMQYQAIFN